jgi:hypothetical protein
MTETLNAFHYRLDTKHLLIKKFLELLTKFISSAIDIDDFAISSYEDKRRYTANAKFSGHWRSVLWVMVGQDGPRWILFNDKFLERIEVLIDADGDHIKALSTTIPSDAETNSASTRNLPVESIQTRKSAAIPTLAIARNRTRLKMPIRRMV